MKISGIVLLILILTLYCFSQNKSQFDLASPSFKKGDNKTIASSSTLLRNTISECTLITGGYYTIGTNHGLSSSAVDDYCQITYGHPYALTSCPVIYWDGQWKKIDEFFPEFNVSLNSINQSIQLVQEKENQCRMVFTITQVDSGKAWDLNVAFRNLDSVNHTIGAGLFFDPALGKNGDGNILLQNGTFLTRDTVLDRSSIPQQLQLWERDSIPHGVGIACEFVAAKPDKMMVGNWREMYNHPSPEFSPTPFADLYDVLLNMSWEPKEVLPDSEYQFTVRIRLLDPDFSSTVFMRWDLPSFLSIENGMLFPREIMSNVELVNMGAASFSNVSFDISSSEKFLNVSSPGNFSLPAGEDVFQKIKFQSSEVYEDCIIPVSLQCKHNNETLCRITRNVFIPAMMLSDSGLVVNIDSVSHPSSSQTALSFDVQYKSTDAFITQLKDENIFLFENNSRIKTFSFGKDTRGGNNNVDLIFALDVTGSMSDEIKSVKDNIQEFADSMNARGVNYRFGMVTFRDKVEKGYDFTTDISLFKSYVIAQTASAGGDEPENSLEALMCASQFSFRASANRIIVWITDASYHENNSITKLTKQIVIDSLLSKGVVVHAIGATRCQTSFYDPIIIPTGGNYYDILGKFRDILLDIARMKIQNKYLLSYSSLIPTGSAHNVRIEVHYAGLGGFAEINFFAPPGEERMNKTHSVQRISCYPNPFNPSTRIKIINPEKLCGVVYIYSSLGQVVNKYSFTSGMDRSEFIWDARNDAGIPVCSGPYFARLQLFDENGVIRTQQNLKLVYMK